MFGVARGCGRTLKEPCELQALPMAMAARRRPAEPTAGAMNVAGAARLQDGAADPHRKIGNSRGRRSSGCECTARVCEVPSRWFDPRHYQGSTDANSTVMDLAFQVSSHLAGGYCLGIVFSSTAQEPLAGVRERWDERVRLRQIGRDLGDLHREVRRVPGDWGRGRANASDRSLFSLF